MRKAVLLLTGFIVFLSLAAACMGDVQNGVVAKVTTGKGALNLRGTADDRARVIDKIPNGTCILITELGERWCQVSYRNMSGYCRADYLTVLKEADHSLLDYRVLRKGDSGMDVLALKKRLQELGYIRNGSELTNVYNEVAAERVKLFQRQSGMTEDGVASQELQAYLFSDKASVCTLELPKVKMRSRVSTQDKENREICGCCMGEGCECCDYKGWISY